MFIKQLNINLEAVRLTCHLITNRRERRTLCAQLMQRERQKRGSGGGHLFMDALQELGTYFDVVDYV